MFRYRLYKIIYFLFLSFPVYADEIAVGDAASSSVGGFGQIASNMLVPVTVVSNFLSGMAVVIGMTCLFSAFIRYLQHRVNPLAQPLGMVVLLLVAGVLLLLLPLIYKFTESGIPFSPYQ